jgi:hypothetical protein
MAACRDRDHIAPAARTERFGEGCGAVLFRRAAYPLLVDSDRVSLSALRRLRRRSGLPWYPRIPIGSSEISTQTRPFSRASTCPPKASHGTFRPTITPELANYCETGAAICGDSDGRSVASDVYYGPKIQFGCFTMGSPADEPERQPNEGP